MNKLLFPLLAAMCFAGIASAQNTKPKYALLWEISGKNFQEKSYLFGTMHLRDERVFELADSVMLAIEACKAFAMEIHPDTIVSYEIDREMQADTSSRIGQMLDTLADRYGMVNGDRLPDSTIFKKNDFIKNLMSGFKEASSTKKRPQILDYTLFGYAKDRDKSLYGLERMQDYRDMAEAFFEKNSLSSGATLLLEDLIKIYQSGDLDALLATFDIHIKNEKLRVETFTNRNIRMVTNMKIIGAGQSTFFAVGAGHLPGDDGMIALLQKEGYTVRKVKATFSGVADSLFQTNKPRDLGITFTDPIAGYSMKVPAKPFFKPLTILSDEGHIITGRLNTVLDLRRGYEFAATSMDYPAPLLFEDKRDVLNLLSEEYVDIFGPMIGKPQDITIDRYPGKQMKYRMRGNYIVDIQVMMRGNRFYAFTSTHPASTTASPGQSFFKSIRILPPAFSPLHPTHIRETGSKADFPNEYKFEADTTVHLLSRFPTDYTLSSSAMDTLSTTMYIVVEHEWSEYFTATDSFFAKFKRELVSDSFEVVRDTLFRSMPAYLLTINNEAGQYFTDHLIIPNDDGMCELIVSHPEAGQHARSWAFFNSFETPKKWTGARMTDVFKKRIFDDFESPDSLTAMRARYALSHTTLTQDDLTQVLNLLSKPMPADTFLWGSIHQRLWQGILEIKDARIIPFAETYFKTNHDRIDRQEYALEAMLTQRSTEAVEAFFRLAPLVDSLESQGDFEFSGLHDYLDSAFVAASLPQLMRLRTHPSFRHVVISALDDVCKETPGIQPAIARYSADLVKDGWQLVQEGKLLQFKDSMPEFRWYWTLLNYIDLAGYFSSGSGSVDFLKKMTDLPDPTICGAATNSLFRLGEKANEKVLQKWHKKPEKWYNLLSSLEKDAYLDFIPSKLLDIETFIEGCIPAILYDYEDIEVKDFKILEKRKHTHEGENLWLYLFTYRNGYEEGPDNLHLGICGQPETGRVKLYPPIINTSYEAYDGRSKEALVKELLERE
ncbi:MAG: TraB/GumN family protein [Saprospiraceae bacterium]|nr:TraB/GumN family protein [Saprospiraceae bacterium]